MNNVLQNWLVSWVWAQVFILWQGFLGNRNESSTPWSVRTYVSLVLNPCLELNLLRNCGLRGIHTWCFWVIIYYISRNRGFFTIFCSLNYWCVLNHRESFTLSSIGWERLIDIRVRLINCRTIDSRWLWGNWLVSNLNLPLHRFLFDDFLLVHAKLTAIQVRLDHLNRLLLVFRFWERWPGPSFGISRFL